MLLRSAQWRRGTQGTSESRPSAQVHSQHMDLHSNFFDEVFERNIVSNSDTTECTPDGQKVKSKSMDYLAGRFDNDFDASKALRIRSADLHEYNRTESWNCGNDSPSTDTTVEDDIEWEHLSENEDCSQGSESSFFDTLFLGDENEEVYKNSKAMVEPKTTHIKSKTDHDIKIEPKNVNTKKFAQNKPPTKAIWSPFGIPIPPALVWFSVMKQQVNKIPLCADSSRKTVAVHAMNSSSNKIKDSAKTAEFVEKHQAKNPNPSASKTERSLAKPKPKQVKKRPFTQAERRQRNRDAAAESRRKKKEHMQEMKVQIEQLRATLADKDRYIQKLESENARLKSQLVTGLQEKHESEFGSLKPCREGTSKIPSALHEKYRAKKRKRFGNSIVNYNTLKVGLAGSMAVCLFTNDGTSTAFALDHVAGVNNHLSTLNMINWIGTSAVLLALILSFVFVSTQSYCRQKTKLFLLPFFYARQGSPIGNRKMPRGRRKYFAYG